MLMVEGVLSIFLLGRRDSPAVLCVHRFSRHSRRIHDAIPDEGRCDPPVAEGDTGPPGPIPNPVVKRVSASWYCGSNAVGDAAAAGGSHLNPYLVYLLV